MAVVGKPLDYPTSDGKPFAESDWHRVAMTDTLRMLQHRYRATSDVYVSSNLLVYYQEGNKRKRVAPDIFLVKGTEKKLRRHYLMWEEQRSLDAVIEVTSARTRREDTTTKLATYRDILKVKELFYFDLFADYLVPRLQGHRLQDGGYTPLPAESGRLFSEVLDGWLEPSALRLLLTDPRAVCNREDDRARALNVERDVLDLLQEIRGLRRETEKLHWRK